MRIVREVRASRGWQVVPAVHEAIPILKRPEAEVCDLHEVHCAENRVGEHCRALAESSSVRDPGQCTGNPSPGQHVEKQGEIVRRVSHSGHDRRNHVANPEQQDVALKPIAVLLSGDNCLA